MVETGGHTDWKFSGLHESVFYKTPKPSFDIDLSTDGFVHDCRKMSVLLLLLLFHLSDRLHDSEDLYATVRVPMMKEEEKRRRRKEKKRKKKKEEGS